MLHQLGYQSKMVNPVEGLWYVCCTQIGCVASCHIVINYTANGSDCITTPDTFFESELIIKAHQKGLITIKDTVFKYFGQYRTNCNSSKVFTNERFAIIIFNFRYRYNIVVSKSIRYKGTKYRQIKQFFKDLSLEWKVRVVDAESGDNVPFVHEIYLSLACILATIHLFTKFEVTTVLA